MALYMLMGRYSPEAIKSIFESGDDREAAARKLIESAGGKLHGFYGMFGQDYHIAAIIEMPGNAEYIGALIPTILSGTLADVKTISLFTAAEVVKASKIAKKAKAAYKSAVG